MPLVRYHIVTYFNMLSAFFIEEKGYHAKRTTGMPSRLLCYSFI